MSSGRAAADDLLAAALAAGRTVKDAALAAGVGERTAYKRLTEPAFTARVRELRAAMVAAAAGRLADTMAEAADTLKALLASTDENVRQRAASKVIELSLKVNELAVLEERIRQLEAQFAGRTGGRRT